MPQSAANHRHEISMGIIPAWAARLRREVKLASQALFKSIESVSNTEKLFCQTRRRDAHIAIAWDRYMRESAIS